jgi:hypothetical protein
MKFIFDFWYLWIIGFIALPVMIVLVLLPAIRFSIDDKGKNPEKIAKMFLEPVPISVCIIGGIGTFICLAFFIASIIMAIIRNFKG